MGLRCSLLGHAFGEPVTERERETRGAEVLITVREVRRCSRCDAEQVISENKEIRHLGSEEEASPDTPSTQPSPEAPARGESESEQPGEASGAPEGQPSAETSLESGPETDTPHPAEATDQEETETPEQEDSDVDVSKLVDAAEGPDAGGPGREPPVGRTHESESEPPQDEDVEIIDGDSDTETSDSESEDDEARAGEEGEPPPTSQEPESTERADEEGSEGRPQPADSRSESAEDEDGAPEVEEPNQTESETTTEDSGPPDDDAIILDNDAGKDARESDVGRREIAGSGNMFEPSAPDEAEESEPAPPRSERGDVETEGETWPGREVEGRDSESDEAQSGEPTEWPTSESVEDAGESDSAFQFGADMVADEAETPSKTPSGLTSEGSIDVPGDPDDPPPKTVECPECGHTADGVGSSLRAGDICPACHDAYLTYRR